MLKGLPFDYCLNPDKGLPLPDLTLYLTVPPEVASSRSAYGVERYETLEIQTRVRAQFDLVAEEVKRRQGAWESIAAVGSIEEVGERIWKLVEPKTTADLGPVGKLWT